MRKKMLFIESFNELIIFIIFKFDWSSVLRIIQSAEYIIWQRCRFSVEKWQLYVVSVMKTSIVSELLKANTIN